MRCVLESSERGVSSVMSAFTFVLRLRKGCGSLSKQCGQVILVQVCILFYDRKYILLIGQIALKGTYANIIILFSFNNLISFQML